MRRVLQLTALLILCGACLALAACGGGDGTTTNSTSAVEGSGVATESDGAGAEGEDVPSAAPSDEQQVRVAIEALLIDPDNEYVCGEVLSEKLLRTAYGDLQGCLDGRGGPTLADSAKIEGLAVEGATASANAVPKGGLYDGEDLEIEADRRRRRVAHRPLRRRPPRRPLSERAFDFHEPAAETATHTGSIDRAPGRRGRPR